MSEEKKELHPRNRHRDRYDFPVLVKALPELKKFVRKNEYGDESIDFSNPEAVKILNQSILKKFYKIDFWDVPQGYLCPPIPGRADYIHYTADLLAGKSGGKIPRGPSVKVLDIGVGANCVYPIIGHVEYDWSFVGTETDKVAFDSALSIVKKNPILQESIDLRFQPNPKKMFHGVIKTNEYFELVISNPPFHSSAEEAKSGSRRKWKNLGKVNLSKKDPVLNFGGQGGELWCDGGEIAFITQMIRESVEFKKQVRWFTALVSQQKNLDVLYAELEKHKVSDGWTIDMAQGQKKSRILAWSFQ